MRGKGGAGDLPCLTRVGFLGSRLGTASRRGGSGVDAGGGPLWPPAAEGCVHLGKKPTRESCRGLGNAVRGAPANSSLPCVRLRRTLLANEIKSAMQCHLSTKS